eukprot:m51a1_g4321 hypothetical protein (317) ;mRNA; r:58510-59930
MDDDIITVGDIEGLPALGDLQPSDIVAAPPALYDPPGATPPAEAAVEPSGAAQTAATPGSTATAAQAQAQGPRATSWMPQGQIGALLSLGASRAASMAQSAARGVREAVAARPEVAVAASRAATWLGRLGGPSVVVLVTGLKGAGKSALLGQLRAIAIKEGGTGFVRPGVVSSGAEATDLRGLSFVALPGEPQLLPKWLPGASSPKSGVRAVVFVVDPADRPSLERASESLHVVAASLCAPGATMENGGALLVVANRREGCAEAECAGIDELIRELRMRAMPNPHVVWSVETECAVSGDGVADGIQWLQNVLQMYF